MKRGFMQLREETENEEPPTLVHPMLSDPLSSALLNRGKSLPIFKLQEIPFPLQRRIQGRKHLCT